MVVGWNIIKPTHQLNWNQSCLIYKGSFGMKLVYFCRAGYVNGMKKAALSRWNRPLKTDNCSAKMKVALRFNLKSAPLFVVSGSVFFHPSMVDPCGSHITLILFIYDVQCIFINNPKDSSAKNRHWNQNWLKPKLVRFVDCRLRQYQEFIIDIKYYKKLMWVKHGKIML